MTRLPALDVGGTHVTGCWVDTGTWRVVRGSARTRPVDAAGTADGVLSAIAACGASLGALTGTTLGVAVPGPFDYDRGVADYHGVGKFDALRGVDVRCELLARLPEPPAAVHFVNDAAAFALGEWVSGAARGHDRSVTLTLGTGIGSGFLAAGRVVVDGPDVPPEGRVDLLRIDGAPLEETASRRALLSAYLRRISPRTEAASFDVAALADRARAGDAVAADVFRTAFRALGVAIEPWLRRFGADLVVVGGSVAGSWDLVARPLREPLAGVEVVRARHLDESACVGAAWHAGERVGDR